LRAEHLPSAAGVPLAPAGSPPASPAVSLRTRAPEEISRERLEDCLHRNAGNLIKQHRIRRHPEGNA
jgi:hypothetical protein